MPRVSRLNCPGGVFHIVSRFTDKKRWLDRAGAREAYLDLLERAVSHTDAQILAYCMMSDHVHIVAVQGNDSLSRLVKSVHTGFARWVVASRRKNAKPLGPIFASRPKMILIDEEEYLLDLVRYVHNNPVRAKEARYARTSDWSSHKAYLGKAETPEWLDTSRVLDRMGKTAKTAIKAFDKYVDEARKEPRRSEFSGSADASDAAAVRRKLGEGYRATGGVLGRESFFAEIQKDRSRVKSALSGRGRDIRRGKQNAPKIDVVMKTILDYLDLTKKDLAERPRARAVSHAKRLLTWVWVREFQGAQIEVARFLDLSTAAISQYYAHCTKNADDYNKLVGKVVKKLPNA